MSFKRCAIALFLVLSSVSLVPGQNQPPPNSQRGGGLVARIQQDLDELKLTDDQKQRINPILEKARQDFRNMAEEMVMAEPEQRREKLGSFLSGVTDRIKPILTAEQSVEFEKRMQRMREQQRGGPGQGPGGAQRPGAILERIRDAVEGLELSEEQRTQARQTLLDARQKLQELRGQLQGDMQALREKFMPIIQETREKLMGMLTPEQRQKLSDMLEERGPRPEFARPRQNVPEAPKKEEQLPAPTTQAAVPDAAAIIAVGQAAPEFTLKKLDGQNVQLSSYKGKIVLLVFGSYSSPSFRQRTVALEKIRRDYGVKINPIVVYTRENHPVGQWEVERNKDEGISVEQPTSMESRTALARQAREALKITSPIVIDAMDDATAKAYGGFTNAAVLIGRDGNVAFRQKWFEPYAMRRAIDEALESVKSAG